MTSPLALIVEDDYDASQIYSKVLQLQGVQSEIVDSGDLAMERLRVIAPQLIVLDLHVPNVTGAELLEWIRESPTLSKTPVLVITADERLGKTISDKADIMLMKPITFTQVRDATTALLKNNSTSPQKSD
jgi:DNA-binding response OmpR family regulator